MQYGIYMVPEDITQIKKVHNIEALLKKYHRLVVCYRWQYNRLRRVRVAVYMTSFVLAVSGASASILFPGAVAGVVAGITLLCVAEKKSLETKMNMFKFAEKECREMLYVVADRRKSDADLTLAIAVVDSAVNRLCPPIPDKLCAKYKKNYPENV